MWIQSSVNILYVCFQRDAKMLKEKKRCFDLKVITKEHIAAVEEHEVLRSMPGMICCCTFPNRFAWWCHQWGSVGHWQHCKLGKWDQVCNINHSLADTNFIWPDWPVGHSSLLLYWTSVQLHAEYYEWTMNFIFDRRHRAARTGRKPDTETA